MTTIVYQITSTQTPMTYYGYAKTEPTNALAAFLVGAMRSDSGSTERADVRLLADAVDVDSLTATVLSEHDDEYEALIARNDARASDVNSISGPTTWPYHDRISQEDPDKAAAWEREKKFRATTCAREAYELGAWSYAEIYGLGILEGQEQVKEDLANLTYRQFVTKYVRPHQEKV